MILAAVFTVQFAAAQPMPQGPSAQGAPATGVNQPAHPNSAIKPSDPSVTKETKELREIKEIHERPSAIVEIFSSWPLAFFAIFLISIFALMASPKLRDVFTSTSRTITSLKIGGIVEVGRDISGLAQSNSRAIEGVEDQIATADRAYLWAAASEDIEGHLGDVMLKALRRVLSSKGLLDDLNGVRGTIHVPDLLFNEFFYQLVGYFPDFEVGAKRRLSQRFGIIGRAWRLDKSLGRGDGKYTAEELITHYGMLPNEAIQSSRHNPSDLCVILRNISDGNRKLGVLFIDGTRPNKFGFDKPEEGALASDVVNALAEQPELATLAEAVARAIVPLRVPKLDLTRTAV